MKAMKTLLTIITYILISANVFAGEASFEDTGKPAPKSETKRSVKTVHKTKKKPAKESILYKMDNGEYYTPKRRPKINYHYQKPSYKNKKRRH